MNSSYESTLSSFLSRRCKKRRRHFSLGYIFVALRNVRRSSSVTYPLSCLSTDQKHMSSLRLVLLTMRCRTSSIETSHSTKPLKNFLRSSLVEPSKNLVGSDSAPQKPPLELIKTAYSFSRGTKQSQTSEQLSTPSPSLSSLQNIMKTSSLVMVSCKLCTIVAYRSSQSMPLFDASNYVNILKTSHMLKSDLRANSLRFCSNQPSTSLISQIA